jgi:hypothetical protein
MNKINKVKKTITYDRMSISSTMLSGESFKFSISRSGEKIVLAFKNDESVIKQQFQVIKNWLSFKNGEDNLQRFDRIEKILNLSNSSNELINAIQ